MDVRVKAAVAGDLEGVNVSVLCRDLGISRQTFYKWRRRYRSGGTAGLEERPRRPLTSPNATTPAAEDLIVRYRKDLTDEGADAGPLSIRWAMEGDGIHDVPSAATIWRVLSVRGFINTNARKRPRSSYVRFERDRANELWQIDATEWSLADGTIVEIINIVDDCSRLAIACKAVLTASCETAWDTFTSGARDWGLPAELLSDNGLAFNGAHRGVEVVFETRIRALGINQIASRPHHPQTCGKVERFHSTQKKWLAAKDIPETLEDLQTLLDVFRPWYNTKRRHSAIGGLTPLQAWTQAECAPPASHLLGAGKIRTHEAVVTAGRLKVHGYIFGVGRAYNDRTLTAIRQGPQVVIFDNDDLVCTTQINPTTQYQKLPTPDGRKRKLK